MIMSLLYVILAILGLSFLVFIHELGHYYMARRLGMRVETFSIGFGKPIYSWEQDGVKWQIGWLLFGGYVKISGMETTGQNDPYQVEGGFFGKKPIDRIKVAFAGPLVNLVSAFLIFSILWVLGGREKSFAEYTNKIGWLDPKSELYAKGVRPGDEITYYGNKPFQSVKDHVYAPMTSPEEMEIKGNLVDFYTKRKTPFHYIIKTYPHPSAIDKDVLTAGVLQPTSYLIYDRLPNGEGNPLPEGSPMRYSGIQYGDRLVWVDGEPIYSVQQLTHLLNDSRVLVTIQRGEQTLLRRLPRVRVEELKLDAEVREELIDWQFEARLNGVKFQKLYTLPYNLNNTCLVEGPVKFIDKDNEEEAFSKHPYSVLEMPLEVGDKIIAIDGIPVTYSFEILSRLQQHHVNIVVQRGVDVEKLHSWQDATTDFDRQFNAKDLENIISKIGADSALHSSGNLYLLNSITPKSRHEFQLDLSHQEQAMTEIQERKKEIEEIEDPEKRAQAMHQLENRDKQLMLGLPLQDYRVRYNPNPFIQFGNVFEDIWRTLTALFTGSLNPKWMSGPIGIVQAAYSYSMSSLKEGLFLLGVISLNLGFLNLLPLPVLDGGTIAFSFYEMITGKRLKPKTLEKLIVPFALLLIGFFIFLSYHDILRLLKNFF